MVQRVSRARVVVAGACIGEITHGLCVLLAAMSDDTKEDVALLAKKVAQLRIFPDSDDKMNLSVLDSGGAVLVVSQFTLAGDARKGNRPSFQSAMDPQQATRLIDDFCGELRAKGIPVQTGQFRAHMQVELVNDGPVTILLDSKRAF